MRPARTISSRVHKKPRETRVPLLMCPNCQASMQAVQRSGVEFDMCPACRGVWLDRGELEKLVGMAREPEQEAPRPQHYNSAPPRDDYRRDAGWCDSA